MCNAENSSTISKNILISRSSSKTFQCLTLLGMEGFYFTSISYLNLGGRGTLKLLAEIARESIIGFSPLGINDILKARKKLSMRSHTSFL